jgi:hypothetical protein
MLSWIHALPSGNSQRSNLLPVHISVARTKILSPLMNSWSATAPKPAQPMVTSSLAAKLRPIQSLAVGLLPSRQEASSCPSQSRSRNTCCHADNSGQLLLKSFGQRLLSCIYYSSMPALLLDVRIAYSMKWINDIAWGTIHDNRIARWIHDNRRWIKDNRPESITDNRMGR